MRLGESVAGLHKEAKSLSLSVPPGTLLMASHHVSRIQAAPQIYA